MQLLFLLIGYTAWFATATITLLELQPIAEFSDSCTQAYGTDILNCDNTLFAPFDQDATCSRACLNELNTLAGTLQKACQADGVKPDTVIAHAFQGDLANWLCAKGTYATQEPTVASGTATNAKATSTAAASTTSSTSSSSTAAQSSSSSSDSSTSTTTSDSSSTESSFTTTYSTTTTSITATPTSSSLLSSLSSSTTSSRPRQTSNTIGDSTPFDQTVLANYAVPTKHDKKALLLVQVLVPTVTSLLVIGIGGWMY